MVTKEQIKACATHYVGAEREAKFTDLVLACRRLLFAKYNSIDKVELEEAIWAMRQVMWPDNGEPMLDEKLQELELGDDVYCID